MTIGDIDSNFDLRYELPDDVKFISCFEAPAEINGLYRPKELKRLTRLPDEFKQNENINIGTRELIHNTAGGRIRFSTDSPYIVVIIAVTDIVIVSHMSVLAHSGADIFVCEKGKDNYEFKLPVIPPQLFEEKDKKYGTILKFSDYDDYGSHEVMINLPPYNGVREIYIGIKDSCALESPVSYVKTEPVYFYGSSVTQGACASRPGNNYPNILSRWLKTDFVNLGFSGSARGEKEIAEYLAKSGASAVVAELDISVNDIDIFKNTHFRFYDDLRKYNETIPVIFISFPKYPKIHHDKASKYRDHVVSNKIIVETCVKGWKNGDENIYYIDGETLFGARDQELCTVDYSHPNDYGFYRMAEGILPILKKALI